MKLEVQLKRAIKKNNIVEIERVFEAIYNTYFNLICFVINKYVNNKLDVEELALHLIEELLVCDKEKLFERYKISDNFEYEMPVEVMEEIGRKRGCLVRGGEIDYTKVANILLDEFRCGKIGNITLECAK